MQNCQQIQNTLNKHLAFLKQDENNITLLIKISALYLELNDLLHAQIHLDKASTIDRVACLGYQGLLKLNQCEFSLAYEYFLEALTHKDTPELRYNLGYTQYLRTDLDDAMQVLSSLLTGKQYPRAKRLTARILYQQKQWDKAVMVLHEILEHDPHDAEAIGLLALVYFDTDQEEWAYEMVQRALILDPENYEARLVHLMRRLITQEVTQDEVEHLIYNNPPDSRLWFILGMVHLNQGQVDLAKHALIKATDIYPEFYDAYIALAWCQLLHDHLDEAEKSYQTAANLVLEGSEAWGGLGLIQALKGERVSAEQFIKKAQKLDKNCFLKELTQSIIKMNESINRVSLEK